MIYMLYFVLFPTQESVVTTNSCFLPVAGNPNQVHLLIVGTWCSYYLYTRHAPQKEGGLKILCDLPPV